MTDANSFRDLSRLTRALRVLLGLNAVCALAMLGALGLQLELLGSEFTEAQAEANDVRMAAAGLAYLAVFLPTTVVFCLWIYRANQNAQTLAAGELRYTPGWAVGYFFVPVVNLWRPYQAMKDLWQASHRSPPGIEARESSVLPLWWTLWIASNAIGQVSMRMGFRSETIEDLRLETWVDIASGAIDIPLALIALVLVSRIWQAQQTADGRPFG